MRMDDYIVALLAHRMWQEAQRVPAEIQKQLASAVGLCLRNRVSQDASWLYVLASSIPTGVVSEPSMEHDPLLIWAIWEAEKIFRNEKPDLTNGSTEWSFQAMPSVALELAQWPGGSFYTFKPKSC